MRNSPMPNANHFPDIYSSNGDLIVSSDKLISVSVFDHWLTPDEAATCEIITYSLAMSASMISEYMRGEEKFIELYKKLARGGLIKASDSERRCVQLLDEINSKEIVDSLREIKSIEMYLIEYSLRIIGSYNSR